MKELKNKIYGYLEFKNIHVSAETDALIDECIEELRSMNSFRCIYKKFTEPLAFLKTEPYLSFLSGSHGYYLCAMTLGDKIDSYISELSVTYPIKAAVFDSCANAYLEFKAEEYEKTLEKDISYKFAPGYQGSDIRDIKVIFDALGSDKIGVDFTEENRITPAKSMVGIIGIGNSSAKKQCGKCIMLNSCVFRKAGKRCFDL